MPNFSLKNRCCCLRRLISKFAVLGFLLAFIPTCFTHAKTDVTFDLSGAEQFLNLVKTSKAGASNEKIEKILDQILDLPAYNEAFLRYNDPSRSPKNRVPKTEFRKMVLMTFMGKTYNGENKRLKYVQKLLVNLIQSPDTFQKVIQKLQANKSRIQTDSARIADDWLPPSSSIKATVYVLVDPGMSFPWAFAGRSVGLDVMQFSKPDKFTFDVDGLILTMAHEFNHLGLQKLIRSDNEPDSRLASLLVGEGAAMKFCNNARTKLSPKAYPDSKSSFLESHHPMWKTTVTETWQHYLDDLDLMIVQAKKDRETLMSGKKIDFNYWVANPTENRPIGRRYYLGAEMMGVIYSAFGKKVALNVMIDEGKLFSTYNRAVKKLGLDKKYSF